MRNIIIGTWNISECVCSQWDIHTGISIDQRPDDTQKCCEEIVNLIKLYNVDIMCFQEFPISVDNSAAIVDYVTHHTELKYYYGVDTYPTFLLQNGRAGIAIFSKLEILSSSFSPFINPNITKMSKSGKLYYTFDKGLITAKFKYNERPFYLVTGHAISFTPFDLIAEDFPESFAEIMNCVVSLNPKENHVIVTGDFNTDNLFGILPELKHLVEDKLEGATTVSGVMEGSHYTEGRKLDYFLVSPSVNVTRTEKVSNFSDHYLCISYCTFT